MWHRRARSSRRLTTKQMADHDAVAGAASERLAAPTRPIGWRHWRLEPRRPLVSVTSSGVVWRPSGQIDDAQYATLEWVGGFDYRRLLEPIGDVSQAKGVSVVRARDHAHLA